VNGQRIGYIRVSTLDQNPERQLEQVQVDRLFTDKLSGKDIKRPQLESLLSFVREGDTVVVHTAQHGPARAKPRRPAPPVAEHDQARRAH
jgi:hypothetical protein